MTAPAVWAQMPAYGMPQAGTSLPSPDGTRQRWVGPHFDAEGKYVAPHYESANKKPPFRGYFPDQMKQQAQRQHGYAEPAPDYSMPVDPDQMKPMEGR